MTLNEVPFAPGNHYVKTFFKLKKGDLVLDHRRLRDASAFRANKSRQLWQQKTRLPSRTTPFFRMIVRFLPQCGQ
jgi:hypothetical protein